MLTQLAPISPQSLPRRSAKRIASDAAFRKVMDHTVGNFTYATLRPEGGPQTCEQFIAEDSSLTVLEMIGPLTELSDKRNSDEVMVSRMYQYPGMPAAEVMPPGNFRMREK